MRILSMMAAALALSAASAAANDSAAALGLGGIVLTKGVPVRMASEDLYISPKQVRVRYEFVNDGDRDFETLVAFPLPDIDMYEFSEVPIGFIGSDPENFVDFVLRIDGKTVAPKIEQRAFVGDKDVTAAILASGAPLNLMVGDNTQKLERLSPEARRRLIDAGIGEDDGMGSLRPKWTLKTKFYWTQRFPAGKPVTVEHAYHPVSGQFFFTAYEFESANEPYSAIKSYCMDAATQAGARTRLAAHKKGAEFPDLLIATTTDYILTTAGNWKGPIGRFHLTLDKLKPDNVISLCWKGKLKKTAPTRFEATEIDFSPRQDIRMVVME